MRAIVYLATRITTPRKAAWDEVTTEADIFYCPTDNKEMACSWTARPEDVLDRMGCTEVHFVNSGRLPRFLKIFSLPDGAPRSYRGFNWYNSYQELFIRYQRVEQSQFENCVRKLSRGRTLTPLTVRRGVIIGAG